MEESLKEDTSFVKVHVPCIESTRRIGPWIVGWMVYIGCVPAGPRPGCRNSLGLDDIPPRPHSHHVGGQNSIQTCSVSNPELFTPRHTAILPGPAR